MIISMTGLGGKKTKVLAGAPNGRTAFAKLLAEAAQEPLAPEPLYLDFTDVDIATASYLRESVLQFRDVIRRQRSNLYPVVANANAQVLEELALLIQASNGILMTCYLDERGTPSQAALIGNLDPKQKLTFELVNRKGETDASELMRDHGAGEDVKQTAWNNRLAALAGLGLIYEVSLGRAKRYRPLFGGAVYGH
jgi:hypothetical protein